MRIVLLLISLFILGCVAEPVAKDLNQQQANEIIAVLNAQGIAATASKETGAAGRYAVSVESSSLTPAIAILNDKGLPRKSRFAELIEPRGLIPNSREMESLRVDYARSLELKELLESHPAVSSAAVTLSRSAGEGALEPGAGIIINLRNGRTIASQEVLSMVARLVPGLKQENIALSIHALDDNGNVFSVDGAVNKSGKIIRIPLVPFLFGWRVAQDDYIELALSVLGFLFLVGMLAGFLGYSYGAYRSGSQDFNANLSEPLLRNPRIERITRELPEE